jgi:hypothetical protein
MRSIAIVTTLAVRVHGLPATGGKSRAVHLEPAAQLRKDAG